MLFKGTLADMALHQLAYSEARQVGLKGAKAAEHVARRLAMPGDLEQRAVSQAMNMTYQEALTGLGKWLGEIRRVPMVRGPLFYPFPRTPYNVLRSPVAHSLRQAQDRRGAGVHHEVPQPEPEQVREFAQRIGRFTFGSSLAAVFAYLYGTGHMTGAAPANRSGGSCGRSRATSRTASTWGRVCACPGLPGIAPQ